MTNTESFADFAAVVKCLDARKPPGNTTGILFGFMDGSGHDPVADHLLDDWHTFALVVANPATLMASALAPCPLLPNSRLLRWNGRKPGTANGKVSRQRKRGYRKHFVENFCPPGQRVLVAAWSYRGHAIYSLQRTLMESVGLAPRLYHRGEGWCEWHRMESLQRMTAYRVGQNADKSLPTGNILVLALAALHVGIFQGVLDHTAQRMEGRKNSGIIIVTDPLLGDGTVQGHQPYGQLLNEMLSKHNPGRVNLRFSGLQDSHAGEIIADNVAGLLQKAISEPSLETANDAWTMLDNPGVIAQWSVYNDDGTRTLYSKTQPQPFRAGAV